MIPITWGTQSSQKLRDGNYNTGDQVLGEVGNGELVFNGSRVSIWKHEKSWTEMVLMVAQKC